MKEKRGKERIRFLSLSPTSYYIGLIFSPMASQSARNGIFSRIRWHNYRTHSETKERPQGRFKKRANLAVPDRVNLDDVFSILEKRVVKADNAGILMAEMSVY